MTLFTYQMLYHRIQHKALHCYNLGADILEETWQVLEISSYLCQEKLLSLGRTVQERVIPY